MRDEMKNWRRWLCAFTYHTYEPSRMIGPALVSRCTFCKRETVR